MSNIDEVMASQVDMSDPFDDVVEIEPTTSATGGDPFDELDEGTSEPESEESNEEEGTETETSEPVEASAEEAVVEDESKDEIGVDELNKQLEDGSFKVKINETDSASLKDLKNSYMGQKEISRRFTEYDVKSKQLDKDTNEINGYVNEFGSKLRNGDSIGAMQFFGEFAGVAPYMIKEQLIAALTPEIIRRENLSSVEVQNEYLNSQNEYLQGQRESELKRKDSEQTQSEFAKSINEIRETNNIDEQTWQDTVSHLEKNLSDRSQLTPELVTETIKYSRMYEQAESVIDGLGETLENREEWLEELVSVKEKYPDFTEEDLADVLNETLATFKKGAVEQKLAKKVESKKAPTLKKQTKQPTPAQSDIDAELEDWF